MEKSPRWNIGTSDWSPYIWGSFHFIAFGYPLSPTEQDKIAYKNFYTALFAVVPCVKCRENREKHMQLCPLTALALSSRANLIKWSYDYHVSVNKAIGSKEFIPEYKHFYDWFKKKVI